MLHLFYSCENHDSISVMVYLDGKETKINEFCGNTKPPLLMSSGPRMKVVFKSESTSKKDGNSGFEIKYKFTTGENSRTI